MKKFKSDNVDSIFRSLVRYIIKNPDFIGPSRTGEMHEVLNVNFELTNINNNIISKNILNRDPDYNYANQFLNFLLSGEKYVTDYDEGRFAMSYPWIQSFTSKKGLPEGFSTAYGPKIQSQLEDILILLMNSPSTRRAVLHILIPEDKLVITSKTTHEYPCCNSIQFLIRGGKLHAVANYRSNSVYKVLPYDLFLMTNLQKLVASKLNIKCSSIHFNIGSAHIFSNDIKQINNEQQ